MTTIAVLGLGEAGTLYAEGLAAAGATVRGFDPFVRAGAGSFQQHDDIGDAVREADIVISFVGALSSVQVAQLALVHLTGSSVFADLNTSSPNVKEQLGIRAAEMGVLFADVAVLAPVPRAGIHTPLMVSGTGAKHFRDLLSPLAVPIESVFAKAGVAASRKLLRSVFMKGLAGVVLESVEAGRAADSEDWIRDQIASELGPGGHALLERLISGTRLHAMRREHEMRDVLDYVQELETPSWMIEATIRWLSHLNSAPEENRS